jgi:hypothetical protein
VIMMIFLLLLVSHFSFSGTFLLKPLVNRTTGVSKSHTAALCLLCDVLVPADCFLLFVCIF